MGRPVRECENHVGENGKSCAVALIYWALVILVETAFHLFQKYNGNHERRAS